MTPTKPTIRLSKTGILLIDGHPLELEEARKIFNTPGAADWSQAAYQWMAEKALAEKPAFKEALEAMDRIAEKITERERAMGLDPAFLRAMETELRANAHKGEWRDWKPTEPEALAELSHHQAKLATAMVHADKKLIREHAADIANICMMIHHQASK